MPTLRAHLRSRAVSRVIYGAVVGLALVVALVASRPRQEAVMGRPFKGIVNAMLARE
jgi:hypothetical protein